MRANKAAGTGNKYLLTKKLIEFDHVCAPKII